MSEMMDIGGIMEMLCSTSDMSFREYQQDKVDHYNSLEGKLHEKDGHNCGICKNKGYIARLDGDCEVHTPCKCLKTRAALKRARASGLNDILEDYTFDKYIATDGWQAFAKKTAQEFCKDEDARWFYIGGQVGSGKTHLCTAICGYYIKAGLDVKYMLWSDESKKLKALITDKTYQDEIAVYKDADVLYIDDFFKVRQGETPSSADVNLAFEIINHRLLSKDKITVISGEKLLDELINYDEATMSRISQKVGRYKISVNADRGKNYRLRGA